MSDYENEVIMIEGFKPQPIGLTREQLLSAMMEERNRILNESLKFQHLTQDHESCKFYEHLEKAIHALTNELGYVYFAPQIVMEL